MEYQYEHIEVETSDELWVEELAQLLAEIIYREMIKGKANEEETK